MIGVFMNIVMNKSLKYISIIMLILSGFSCTKNLNKTINNDILYRPEYSLPIGPLNYTLNDIMPKVVLGFPVDTSLIPDTIPLITYDDIIFPDPFGHNATFLVPYDFSTLTSQANQIKSLMFRVNYVNEMPTYSDLQVYFMNSTGAILDSLYNDALFRLEAADIDQDGNVIQYYNGQNDTYLDSVKIRHLVNSQFLRINMFIATNRTDQKVVRFYSDMEIRLQFAIRAKLEIPLGN